MKFFIKLVAYIVTFILYEVRIHFAKGWRKIYWMTLSPPNFNRLEFQQWLRLGDFRKFLETYHKDLLRTPFSKLYYTIDYILCAFLLGAAHENYFRLMLYKNNWAYRKKCITRRRLGMIFLYLNHPDDLIYLNEKTQFAKHWKDFFNRTYCELPSPECTREYFTEAFKNCEKIIVKPTDSRGGKGIRVLPIDRDLGEIYDELTADGAHKVVEEYIAQTGLLHEFNPTSLNTVRVITIRHNDDITVMAATLRVGGKGAVIDNLHAGGCGYTVYPENGKIYPGIFLSGLQTDTHPDTGIMIAGHTIPSWDKVKQFCIDAHRIAPAGLNYIGWDVCISEDQLYMIEGNGFPGAPPCVEDQDHWKTICRYFDSYPEIYNEYLQFLY